MPKATVFVPGRVNLIGEYTDLIGGSVLPMPLEKGVTVSVGPTETATSVYSSLTDETVSVDLVGPSQNGWTDYVVGPLVVLKDAGVVLPPMNICIEATLPAGAGVSSSAALEVAIVRAALELGSKSMSAEEIARLAQQAENEFCGVQCGIMDQMAVAAGKSGNALALDCETLVSKNIPIPEGWSFAVIHCGQERQLSDGAYNERRASIKAAEAELGSSLKQLALDDVEKLRDPLVRRRARHIVGEQIRVTRAVEAMNAGDAADFGRLMIDSHKSLAQDFEVSTDALDALVEAARMAGAKGARLTGAGFGGCIVALIDASEASKWWQQVSAKCPAAWLVQI
jgi:galactokinase